MQKRLADYEKVRVRLEHKKRKPKPLTKKGKRKELVSKLPKRAGSWGATGEGVRHGCAVLVTRRASEKPPVKSYPKKHSRRSEPEVDVDVWRARPSHSLYPLELHAHDLIRARRGSPSRAARQVPH